ncbi:Translation elongation factor P Lys34--(R)-beta-lysine ligase, partial [hydrothermal vent metagenome]
MLKLRAKLLQTVRYFFDDHDYWEVETPLLSHDVAVDLWLEPFITSFEKTPSSTQNRKPLFLQTSPEFGMKRLLASGAKSIYQITRSFRNGEVGTLHNPEFTILEWYRVGDNHFDQMCVVEALVRKVFDVASHWVAEHADDFIAMQTPFPLNSKPFRQISYDAAFLQNVGSRVLGLTSVELKELAIAQKIKPPESLSENLIHKENLNDCDEWLNLLLAESVEPHLGKEQPEFLYDYPASQAALAQVRDGNPPVAERFELYIS